MVIVHSYDGNIGGRGRTLAGPVKYRFPKVRYKSLNIEPTKEKSTLTSPTIKMIGVCSVGAPLPRRECVCACGMRGGYVPLFPSGRRKHQGLRSVFMTRYNFQSPFV